MKTDPLKFLWIIPIFAIFQSCHLNDAMNIEGPVVYSPIFSLPLGNYTVSFKDIFDNIGLEQADTITGSDTLQKLWYDNNLYHDTKGYYDTSMTTLFNFDFLKSQSEVIKSIMFRINYLSELPCNSSLQLYFKNGGGKILDSLFIDGPILLEAADTNQSGFVESVHAGRKETFFDNHKIAMLQQVSQLEFNLIIYTKHDINGYYKFLSNYIVSFQAGIRVEIDAEI